MDIITLALAKKYVQKSLEGAGALKGQDGLSAYEVAKNNGFAGSEQEWLKSLVGAKGDDGKTPYIGDNGNWHIDGKDCGVAATPTMSYTSLSNTPTLNGVTITGDLTSEDIGIEEMTNQEVDELF